MFLGMGFWVPVFFSALFLVVGQSIHWRLIPSDSPRILPFCLWSGMSLLFVIVLGTTLNYDLAALAAIVLVQAAFIFWYFFFYTGIARSVSLTLLIELSLGFSENEVRQRYEKSTRFEERIELLANLGWVYREDGFVVLTPKGKQMAKGLKFWSHFLGNGLKG